MFENEIQNYLKGVGSVNRGDLSDGSNPLRGADIGEQDTSKLYDGGENTFSESLGSAEASLTDPAMILRGVRSDGGKMSDDAIYCVMSFHDGLFDPSELDESQAGAMLGALSKFWFDRDGDYSGGAWSNMLKVYNDRDHSFAKGFDEKTGTWDRRELLKKIKEAWDVAKDRQAYINGMAGTEEKFLEMPLAKQYEHVIRNDSHWFRNKFGEAVSSFDRFVSRNNIGGKILDATESARQFATGPSSTALALGVIAESALEKKWHKVDGESDIDMGVVDSIMRMMEDERLGVGPTVKRAQEEASRQMEGASGLLHDVKPDESVEQWVERHANEAGELVVDGVPVRVVKEKTLVSGTQSEQLALEIQSGNERERMRQAVNAYIDERLDPNGYLRILGVTKWGTDRMWDMVAANRKSFPLVSAWLAGRDLSSRFDKSGDVSGFQAACNSYLKGATDEDDLKERFGTVQHAIETIGAMRQPSGFFRHGDGGVDEVMTGALNIGYGLVALMPDMVKHGAWYVNDLAAKAADYVRAEDEELQGMKDMVRAQMRGLAGRTIQSDGTKQGDALDFAAEMIGIGKFVKIATLSNAARVAGGFGKVNKLKKLDEFGVRLAKGAKGYTLSQKKNAKVVAAAASGEAAEAEARIAQLTEELGALPGAAGARSAETILALEKDIAKYRKAAADAIGIAGASDLEASLLSLFNNMPGYLVLGADMAEKDREAGASEYADKLAATGASFDEGEWGISSLMSFVSGGINASFFMHLPRVLGLIEGGRLGSAAERRAAAVINKIIRNEADAKLKAAFSATMGALCIRPFESATEGFKIGSVNAFIANAKTAATDTGMANRMGLSDEQADALGLRGWSDVMGGVMEAGLSEAAKFGAFGTAMSTVVSAPASVRANIAIAKMASRRRAPFQLEFAISNAMNGRLGDTKLDGASEGETRATWAQTYYRRKFREYVEIMSKADKHERRRELEKWRSSIRDGEDFRNPKDLGGGTVRTKMGEDVARLFESTMEGIVRSGYNAVGGDIGVAPTMRNVRIFGSADDVRAGRAFFEPNSIEFSEYGTKDAADVMRRLGAASVVSVRRDGLVEIKMSFTVDGKQVDHSFVVAKGDVDMKNKSGNFSRGAVEDILAELDRAEKAAAKSGTEAATAAVKKAIDELRTNDPEKYGRLVNGEDVDGLLSKAVRDGEMEAAGIYVPKRSFGENMDAWIIGDEAYDGMVKIANGQGAGTFGHEVAHAIVDMLRGAGIITDADVAELRKAHGDAWEEKLVDTVAANAAGTASDAMVKLAKNVKVTPRSIASNLALIAKMMFGIGEKARSATMEAQRLEENAARRIAALVKQEADDYRKSEERRKASEEIRRKVEESLDEKPDENAETTDEKTDGAESNQEKTAAEEVAEAKADGGPETSSGDVPVPVNEKVDDLFHTIINGIAVGDIDEETRAAVQKKVGCTVEKLLENWGYVRSSATSAWITESAAPHEFHRASLESVKRKLTEGRFDDLTDNELEHLGLVLNADGDIVAAVCRPDGRIVEGENVELSPEETAEVAAQGGRTVIPFPKAPTKEHLEAAAKAVRTALPVEAYEEPVDKPAGSGTINGDEAREKYLLARASQYEEVFGKGSAKAAVKKARQMLHDFFAKETEGKKRSAGGRGSEKAATVVPTGSRNKRLRDALFDIWRKTGVIFENDGVASLDIPVEFNESALTSSISSAFTKLGGNDSRRVKVGMLRDFVKNPKMLVKGLRDTKLYVGGSGTEFSTEKNEISIEYSTAEDIANGYDIWYAIEDLFHEARHAVDYFGKRSSHGADPFDFMQFIAENERSKFNGLDDNTKKNVIALRSALRSLYRHYRGGELGKSIKNAIASGSLKSNEEIKDFIEGKSYLIGEPIWDALQIYASKKKLSDINRNQIHDSKFGSLLEVIDMIVKSDETAFNFVQSFDAGSMYGLDEGEVRAREASTYETMKRAYVNDGAPKDKWVLPSELSDMNGHPSAPYASRFVGFYSEPGERFKIRSEAVARRVKEEAERIGAVTEVDKAETGKPALLLGFHGTRNGGFSKFDPSMSDDGISLFAAGTKRTAQPQYSNLAVRFDNPLVIDANGSSLNEIRNVTSVPSTVDGVSKRTSIVEVVGTTRDVARHAKVSGHDGVIIKNCIEDGGRSREGAIADTIMISFNGINIKSVDDMTFDDAGNEIPLDRRFDWESDDSKYQIFTNTGLNRMVQSGFVSRKDADALREKMRAAYAHGASRLFEDPKYDRRRKARPYEIEEQFGLELDGGPFMVSFPGKDDRKIRIHFTADTIPGRSAFKGSNGKAVIPSGGDSQNGRFEYEGPKTVIPDDLFDRIRTNGSVKVSDLMPGDDVMQAANPDVYNASIYLSDREPTGDITMYTLWGAGESTEAGKFKVHFAEMPKPAKIKGRRVTCGVMRRDPADATKGMSIVIYEPVANTDEGRRSLASDINAAVASMILADEGGTDWPVVTWADWDGLMKQRYDSKTWGQNTKFAGRYYRKVKAVWKEIDGKKQQVYVADWDRRDESQNWNDSLYTFRLMSDPRLSLNPEQGGYVIDAIKAAVKSVMPDIKDEAERNKAFASAFDKTRRAVEDLLADSYEMFAGRMEARAYGNRFGMPVDGEPVDADVKLTDAGRHGLLAPKKQRAGKMASDRVLGFYENNVAEAVAEALGSDVAKTVFRDVFKAAIDEFVLDNKVDRILSKHKRISSRKEFDALIARLKETHGGNVPAIDFVSRNGKIMHKVPEVDDIAYNDRGETGTKRSDGSNVAPAGTTGAVGTMTKDGKEGSVKVVDTESTLVGDTADRIVDAIDEDDKGDTRSKGGMFGDGSTNVVVPEDSKMTVDASDAGLGMSEQRTFRDDVVESDDKWIRNRGSKEVAAAVRKAIAEARKDPEVLAEFAAAVKAQAAKAKSAEAAQFSLDRTLDFIVPFIREFSSHTDQAALREIAGDAIDIVALGIDKGYTYRSPKSGEKFRVVSSAESIDRKLVEAAAIRLATEKTRRRSGIESAKGEARVRKYIVDMLMKADVPARIARSRADEIFREAGPIAASVRESVKDVSDAAAVAAGVRSEVQRNAIADRVFQSFRRGVAGGERESRMAYGAKRIADAQIRRIQRSYRPMDMSEVNAEFGFDVVSELRRMPSSGLSGKDLADRMWASFSRKFIARPENASMTEDDVRESRTALAEYANAVAGWLDNASRYLAYGRTRENARRTAARVRRSLPPSTRTLDGIVHRYSEMIANSLSKMDSADLIRRIEAEIDRTSRFVEKDGERTLVPGASGSRPVSLSTTIQNRGIQPRLQAYWKYAKECFHMTDDAIMSERNAIEEFLDENGMHDVAKVGDRPPSEIEADARLDIDLAVMKLHALDNYGGLARKDYAEILDAYDSRISKDIFGAAEEMMLRAEAKRNELAAQRARLVDGLKPLLDGKEPPEFRKAVNSIAMYNVPDMTAALAWNLEEGSPAKGVIDYLRRQLSLCHIGDMNLRSRLEVMMRDATRNAYGVDFDSILPELMREDPEFSRFSRSGWTVPKNAKPRLFRTDTWEEVGESDLDRVLNKDGSVRKVKGVDVTKLSVGGVKVVKVALAVPFGHPEHDKPSRTDTRLSKAHLIYIYSACRQADMKANNVAFGRDAAYMADLERTIGPEGVAIADALSDIYEVARKELSDTSVRLTGMPVQSPGEKYSPLRFEQDPSIVSSRKFGVSPFPTFLMHRANHDSANLVESDVFSVAVRRFADSSHWARFAELADWTREVVCSPEVMAMYYKAYGAKAARRLFEQVNDAFGGGTDSNDGATLRNFVAVSTLGYNVRSAIKQLEGIGGWAFEMGPLQWTKAILTDWTFNGAKTLDAMRELDAAGVFSTRRAEGMNQALATLFDARTYGALGGVGYKMIDKYKRSSMSVTMAVDAVATRSLAASYYLSRIRFHEASGMSELDAKRAAVADVDYAIQVGQQSGRQEFFHSAQRGGGYGKFLTQFMGPSLVRFGYELEAAHRAMFVDKSAKARVKFLGKFFTGHVICPAALAMAGQVGTYIFGRRDEKNARMFDGFVQNLVVSMVTGPLAGWFIIGEILSYAFGKGVERATGVESQSRSYGVPMAQKLERLAKSTSKTAMDLYEAAARTMTSRDVGRGLQNEIVDDLFGRSGILGQVFAPLRLKDAAAGGYEFIKGLVDGEKK